MAGGERRPSSEPHVPGPEDRDGNAPPPAGTGPGATREAEALTPGPHAPGEEAFHEADPLRPEPLATAEADLPGRTPPGAEPDDRGSDGDAREATAPASIAGASERAGGLLGADPSAPPSELPELPGQAETVTERRGTPFILVGLGLAVIVMLAAVLYTLYNPPPNAALTAAEANVAALSRRVEAAEAKAAAIGALDGRLTALSGDLDQVRANLARGNDPAVFAAQAKAALAPLDARVGQVDAALGALKGTVAGLPKIDLGPLEGKVADLGTQGTALADKLAGLGTQQAALADKLAGLDKRFAPVEAYFQAPKAGVQVTEARQNGSAAESRAAPVAVIAQGILDAIDAGRPFPTEAKALATLGVPESQRAPLDAVAVKGAATRSELLSGFGAVENAAVAAAAPAPVSTGTALDRIFANAQSLVKVNRTGTEAGPDAGAVSTRITDDLRRGDLPAAATEWDALPEASRAKSAAWADRLKARIAAESAARSIAAAAVAALATVQ